jgi:trans-aconitate 2-methyltransferase
MPWNPDRYHQFKHERAAPFYDLLALVEVSPNLNVVDLGCGSGELTRVLADTLADAQVLGLDSSSEMLARASDHARAGLRFEQGDQADLTGAYDLIFSNASLQWSDNHTALIPNLYRCLAPGGQIAVQMPSNHTHYSHRLITQTASEEPFRTILNGWHRISPVLAIDAYAQMFYDLGATEIVVFDKIYPHVLADADAIADWVSGTALVPYFERLGAAKDDFMNAYRAKLREVVHGGPVFYPFKRILFSARRPRA